MDEKRFWDVIAAACPHGADEGEWHDNLVRELKKLEPEDVVAFDHLFDDKTGAAYTVDLWGAAYTINGGASDDGFYYFRCWLVGMGKKVYVAALANPDSLADVLPLPDDMDAEAEIYSVGRTAWEQLGLAEEAFDAAYEELRGDDGHFGLAGTDWDFDDVEEVKKRFPRLAALYDYDDEEEYEGEYE